MDDLPSAQGPPIFPSFPTPEKEQVQLNKKRRVGSPGPAVPPLVFDPPPHPRMQGEMPPPDRPSSRGNLVDPEMVKRKASRDAATKKELEERDRLLRENPPGPQITGFFRRRSDKGGRRKTKRKMKRKNKKSRKHKK